MGAKHPNLYLDLDEIERLRGRVESGRPLWRELWQHYVEEADRALGLDPNPVVGRYSSGDWGVYRDGHPNPNWVREHYFQLIHDCHRVRSLGLLYAVTGRETYARKAVRTIDAWVQNMEPVASGGQPGMETAITLPGMIWGADLCDTYPGWSQRSKDGFAAWLTALADTVDDFRENNHGDWANHLYAAIGAYTGVRKYYRFAIDDPRNPDSFKNHIGASITPEGVLPHEKRRANGLGYSTYALEAWCLTAEIARHQGQEFRERYDFLKAIEGGASEMEKLLLLRDWVHRQIPSGWPVVSTSDPFEILDASACGGAFYCTHYSYVMQACLAACGWVGRKLGIDSDHTWEESSTHHGVVDVFVNELGKWVTMDAHHEVHYEKGGMPLSPWEVAQEYVADGGKAVDICVGLDRKKVEQSNKHIQPGRHESCCYFWCQHHWHSDLFTPSGSWTPGLKLVLVGDAHEGKTWYQGRPPETHPHICYTNGSFQFTRREADVYPDVGTCHLSLSKGGQPGTVRVSVGTLTPGYESIRVQVDAGDLRPSDLSFDWYLHGGENRLSVCTRNRFGVLGKPSTVRAVLEKQG